MTLARPQRRISAAQTRAFGTTAAARARRHGAALVRMATLAVFGLLVAAAPAGAIIISGGPTDTPTGGWTCTAPVASTEKLAGGGNYSCSGPASPISNLYLGIDRLTTLPFGEKMNSTGTEPSGAERFVWSVNGGTTIRYTGQTTYNGAAVFTRATLTFSGSGTVVDDATTQALTGTNINGSVHALWRIGSGVTSMTVNVLIEASDAVGGPFSPASTFFGTTTTHRDGTGNTENERSHVDIAFYTSTCGDSQTDTVSGTDGSAEQCDEGASNGSATSCCTAACLFRAGGSVCRTSAGVCDVQETCTGSNEACPTNGFVSSATECRSSSGICDPAENCTGSSAPCPGDTFSSAATVCRSSAGVCDPAEHCTGSSGPCPADTISSSATVCRPSAGICDIAENCTGSDADCPANEFEASTVECRSSAGVCDVAESCTGSDADCPSDTFEPATLECRASAGVCDVAESCTGSGADCPADALEPATVECRSSAGVCDVGESCTGSDAACPPDAFEPASLECRATAGICDVAENCDGGSAACPADAFEPATVECRPDAGQCDVAENCTGSQADCPAEGYEPDGTSCDDTITCTIEDSCVAGACAGNPMTCGDGSVQGSCAEECDDGNTDSNDGCSSNCLIEIGLACPETPLTGCKPPFVPGKSSLQLSNKALTNTKDSFKFKWQRGTRTTLADYGAPLTTTNYQVCLYDQTGIRIEVTNPAGGTCAGKPCWKPTGFNGFKYSDKELTPDGGQKLSLKQGAVEKAKIGFSGVGANLEMPDLSTLVQPIVVQIHNSDGVCWQAIFSGPPSKHTAEQFKAKAD